MARKHIGKRRPGRPHVEKRPPKKKLDAVAPPPPAPEPAPKPALLAPARSFGANLSTEISSPAD